jgi:crossover junction endodeoxyribonuclease RuvC
MKVVGIDPGLQGAIAVLDGASLVVYDVPIIDVVTNGKTRHRISPLSLREMFSLIGKAHCVFIESVCSFATDGHVGAFSFGEAYGRLCQVALNISDDVTVVTPKAWRHALGIPKSEKGDKIYVLSAATEYFPQHVHYWEGKRGNGPLSIRSGRAEAALIARYGETQKLRGANVNEIRSKAPRIRNTKEKVGI